MLITIGIGTDCNGGVLDRLLVGKAERPVLIPIPLGTEVIAGGVLEVGELTIRLALLAVIVLLGERILTSPLIDHTEDIVVVRLPGQIVSNQRTSSAGGHVCTLPSPQLLIEETGMLPGIGVLFTIDLLRT